MTKWTEEELQCPIVYMLNIIGGKWKWLILYRLAEHECLRYGEIKRTMPSITHKVLTQQLKEMESDEIINRKEYYQIPPKVEYSLTEKGKTLIPILNSMKTWGQEHQSEHNN